MTSVGYYDQDFEPWVRSIRSIGSAIVQAPMLRAAAADRAQRAQLTQAQIGTEGAQQQHYRAQSGKTDAETAILVKKGQLVTALEQSAAQAQQDIAAGNTDTPAVRAFSGAASALTGVNGDDIVKSAREGIGTLLGRMGKVTEAAAVENPVELEKARIGASSRENVGTAANASREAIAKTSAASREKIARTQPRTVSRDAGLFDPESGDWMVEKPNRPSGNANNLYDPATRQALTTLGEELAKNYATGNTTNIAKLEGQIDTIKKRARGAESSATLPTRPVRTRMGDVLSAASMPNQSQDPDDPSEPVEEPAGQEDDSAMPAPVNRAAVVPVTDTAGKVRVISPAGKPGRIPKEQLDAALAQGFKLAQ